MEQNRAPDLLTAGMVNLAAADTQRLYLPEADARLLTLDVLRLDKIDPVISGNKWFKLKYYLEDALQNGHRRLLSFGGAWSNHIVATACAARKAGLESTGIIRGEKPAFLSGALQKAQAWGMQLVFVPRETYNQKKDPAFIEQLLQQYGPSYIIPEGGAGTAGIKGAAEIGKLVDLSGYSHLLCAVGTGTMLSGLALGAAPGLQITGIPVLKGFERWRPEGLPAAIMANMVIQTGYHQGGYAKKNGQLIDFMNGFYAQTGIPTDFVYTGKLFFSMLDLIKKDYFPSGSRVLAIHSGGLQGNDSLPPGTLAF